MSAALLNCAMALGLVTAMNGLSVQAAVQSGANIAEFDVEPQVTDIDFSTGTSTQYADASGEALINLM
ncbi:MAG: hypothetical protein ACKVKL_04910, partial [Pseudomonadales bacterium]